MLNEKLCTTEGAALLEQVKRDLALAVQDQTEGSSEKGIMTITGVMVRGPQHSVSMLTQRLPVENIRLIPLNEKDDPSLKQSSTSYAVTATAETWVPEEGTCLTGQYSDTRRTVCQWLRWDDKSGFTSNSTYEHDFSRITMMEKHILTQLIHGRVSFLGGLLVLKPPRSLP